MVERDLFGDVPEQARRASPVAKPKAAPPQNTWFFALRPSADEAARIHAFGGDFLARRGLSASRRAPGLLHVSLDAVGSDVSAEVVEAACLAADTVTHPPVEIRFDAVAMFGGQSVVLIPGEQQAALKNLRWVLACAMADRGWRPPKEFNPHMTLCYQPSRQVDQTPVSPISFRATEFVLVKSPQGFSRHEILRTWPLASQ